MFASYNILLNFEECEVKGKGKTRYEINSYRVFYYNKGQNLDSGKNKNSQKQMAPENFWSRLQGSNLRHIVPK